MLTRTNQKINDYQAIEVLGGETCKPLIKTAIREATEQVKHCDGWLHISEVLLKENRQDWAHTLLLGTWAQARIKDHDARANLERLLKAYRYCEPRKCKKVSAQEIKEKVDLVEFIGQYTELKKYGRNFRGLCPLHNEKTPSFYVRPDKGWHCFGCNKGGDVIDFVKELNQCDFKTALEKVRSV